MEATTDLCDAYLPVVFGGVIDPWTPPIEPGSWRGTEWPCTGRLASTSLPGLTVVCTCRCHRGEFTHVLPEGSAPRTGVHPTEVLA